MSNYNKILFPILLLTAWGISQWQPAKNSSPVPSHPKIQFTTQDQQTTNGHQTNFREIKTIKPTKNNTVNHPINKGKLQKIGSHIKGEFIVTVSKDIPKNDLNDILSDLNLRIAKEYHSISPDNNKRTIYIKPIDPSKIVGIDAITAYPEFEQVSLNYIMEAYQLTAPVFPADPRFNEQWNLNQDNDNPLLDDVDIDAPEAWAITPTNTEVVVAVIDTGVDYHHHDLVNKMWTNPIETVGDANGDGYPGIKGVDDDGDGFIDEDSQNNEPEWSATGEQVNPHYLNDLTNDDDENGYEDDIYGIDPGDGDSDPMDINNSHEIAGHGTHIAGIIAAEHNNIGIAGVSVKAKIMAIKGFDSLNGQLTSASELAALDYVIDMKKRGVNIVAINASYGCEGCYNPTQKGKIADAINMGIIFVAAAANSGNDNDIFPAYPASYDLNNILSVAATSVNDELENYSNYGLNTVHLGAPGHGILSTSVTNDTDREALAYRSGTSMSTAMVSGAVAAVAGVYPYETASYRWSRIMDNVDIISSLESKTISGGRLNLAAALTPSAICPADTHGDGDVDGVDLVNFITTGTAFGIAEMASGYGSSACY